MDSIKRLPGFTAEVCLQMKGPRYQRPSGSVGSQRTGVVPCSDDCYCGPGEDCQKDCGFWGGNHHSDTNPKCGPGQHGHCWCGDQGAGFGVAYCACEPGAPPHGGPHC